MLTVNWQHIILDAATYSGHRVARVTGSSGALVPYRSGSYPVAGFTWSPTRSEPDAAPRSYDYTDGRRYVFAFWSMTSRSAAGGLPGGTFYPNLVPSDTFPSPPTSWVLDVKAWYVWDFAGGGGDNGIYLDAFDVTAGNFIAPDFVDVLPDDAAGTKTRAANDGLILTSGAGNLITRDETITARDPLFASFGTDRFSSWLTVDSLTQPPDGQPGAPAISDDDPHQLVVQQTAQGSILVAFAFYTEAERRDVGVQAALPILGLVWTDEGWVLGPVGPPPPGPIARSENLRAAIRLTQAAELVSGKARAEILKSARSLALAAADELRTEAQRHGQRVQQPPQREGTE